MNVKIDTKEKFTVITPNQSDITANMTGFLAKTLLPYLDKEIPHIILNMNHVKDISDEAVELIAGLQQQFYDKNVSFIVCELQNNVESSFNRMELLDVMNVTPTESEAWDILQMEEVERDIMRDFDNSTDG